MEDRSSKTFLISEESRRTLIRSKRRKKCIWGLVIILIFVSLATVIGISTYFLRKKYTPVRHSVQNLGDILPKSFYVEFEGSVKEKGKWMPDNSSAYYVQVDFEKKDFRYLKTTAKKRKKRKTKQTPSDIHDLDTTVTIVNDQAIATFLYNGQNINVCHDDVYADGLFKIIQMAPNAVLKQEKAKNKRKDCKGQIWSIPTCADDIIICEKGSRIVSIKQGNTMATVKNWNSKRPRKIELPLHTETCRYVDKKMGDIKNCPKKPPRRKSNLLKGSSKKDCLFIHGAGEKRVKEGFQIVNSFRSYWGDVEDITPGCKTHSFIQMDTVHHGWDEKNLQENFCKFAGGVNSTVKNKVIFSHSMGNLIVGAAFHNNVCTFDKNSTKWYSIQAPWRGSKAADTLNLICSGKFLKGLVKALGPIVTKVMELLQYCSESGEPSRAYTSLKTNYSSPFGISYQNVIDTAKKFVTGAMCGESPTGLWKSLPLSLVLDAVQKIVKLGKPNDGVVSFKSCNIMGEFSETYHDKFYKTHANHYEGSCRLGDSKWHFPGIGGRKPCSWIKSRDI